MRKMIFELIFTEKANSQLDALECSKDKKIVLKAVRKTLALIETNLKHPSLQTHEYSDLDVNGEKVFESYAQNRTVGGILDGLIGVGAGGATLVTGGSIPGLNDYAFSHLYTFQEVLTGPYRYFLKTIDPTPKFHFGNEWTDAGGMGWITDYFIDELGQSASQHTQSDSLFRQHVLSRLTYGLLAIACIVGRLADAILSIPFTLLSICTLGKFTEINNIAYRTLQAPNLVGDLFLCAAHFINPFINQVLNIHHHSWMSELGKEA